MATFLPRFVERPVLVLMVTISILVIGIIALFRLPLQLMPNGLSSDTINIGASANGMTPEEVEKELYAPLEGELLTIPGVLNVRGRCSAGGMRCWVDLSEGLDRRLASAEVRDRIQRARLQWPPEADRWWTWRESADSIPLMFFSLTLPDRNQATYDLIDKEIVPALEALDGVGQVMIFGMVDQTVRILFDRGKLRAHRSNLREILTKLQTDNVSIPVGELREGDSRLVVRADLVYRSLEQIRDLPIGGGLHLRDVAAVERVRSYRDRIARVNGKYSFTGLISKRAGANTVDAGREVRALMDRLTADRRFKGLEPVYMFDQGEFISHSVGTLRRSALQGGILAFIVLFLFLRRLKMTLAISLSLPLSLLVAAGVMFFEGSTLNILSMAGLTMALGMLVDNSVVVLENIYRLRQSGTGWIDACKQGVQEVGTAVALATLTSVVVFLPMMFASDNPGAQTMLTAFGVPLCAALIASLFVALILLPSMTAVVHRSDRTEHVPGDSRRGLIAWMTRWQARALEWSLAHRGPAIVVATLFVAIGVFAGTKVERGIGGGGMRGQVSIWWKFPRGTTLDEADQTVAGYEAWLEKRREKWRIKDVSARFGRRDANLNLSFAAGTPSKWARDVIRQIRTGIPQEAGIEPEVHSRIGGGEEEAKEGDRGFYIRLSGRDATYLREWADQIKEGLLASGLAESVDLGRASGQDEVRMQISRNRMQELAVNPRMLLGVVGAGLSGQQVSRFREADGRDLRLIAEYSDSKEMELADLKDLQIFSPQTGFNRLGSLARFEFGKGYSSIYRRNGVLVNWVGGSRAENVEMSGFVAGLRRIMRGISVPRGYKWSMDGDARRENDDFSAIFQAMLLALVLVVLVMGVLFESVILPLAVGSTLVPALVYGKAGLLVFGRLQDTAAAIGYLILVGVVVNNGIVLLDHIVRLRRQGLSRHCAIVQGMHDRFRPILMTAATTVVGLMPMMFTEIASQRGISYVGMSTVVASGLICATFLTPVLVPLSYTILDDTRTWWAQLRRRAPRAERRLLVPDSSAWTPVNRLRSIDSGR